MTTKTQTATNMYELRRFAIMQNKRYRIIEGPRGAGKTTLARAMHNRTDRKPKRFPDPTTTLGQEILQTIKKENNSPGELARLFAKEAQEFHEKQDETKTRRIIDRHAVTTGYAIQAIKNANAEALHFECNALNAKSLQQHALVIIINPATETLANMYNKDKINHPTNATYIHRVQSVCSMYDIPHVLYKAQPR